MNIVKIVFLDSMTVGAIPELNMLRSMGELVLYPYTNDHEVKERIVDADIIMTNKVKITKEHILNAKNLKMIQIIATGMDNVDVAFAKKRNIIVENVCAYATETVAQHTFAVLLHLLHNVGYYDDFVKNGSYSKHQVFTCFDKEFYQLKNKTLGIIGLGNIGKSIARIAQNGFGMKVIYHSASGENINTNYPHRSLEELLKTSNIVSINSALTPYTQSLIDLNKIKLMRSDAILINMGRGGIVVEEDLAEAINRKIIKGACVDVFEKEPLPFGHPFLNIVEKDRIVLTPHNGWTAVEARRSLMQSVNQNIGDFINNLKGVSYSKLQV